jgi:shikimate dehydrogenase
VEGLAGWNTDVTALRAALAGLAGSVVMILGTGGAAAAAAAAAPGRPVLVAARRESAGHELAQRVDPGVTVVPWGAVVADAVVVNATPLGMQGESLPAGVVEAAAGLIDLAYGVEETPAVAVARSRGVPAIDGIALLVAQAAASFEIWTGRAAPRAVMEQAARQPETLKAP